MMETYQSRGRTRRRKQLSLLFILGAFVNSFHVGHALNVNVATSKTALSPTQLRNIIKSPHIGYVADESDSLEIFVIGTSHFRCNSAREVTSLIEQVQPDGVVLELDPERVIRLTKQYAGFDENGSKSSRGRQEDTDELLYGADFLAAVNACQQLDIPMFLGDEYAQETKSRLMQQLLNWRAYSPAQLLQSLIASARGDDGTSRVRMDFIQTFVNDPQKLKPILFTSSPPFLLASALAFMDSGASAYDGSTISNTIETLVSIVISFMGSCLLFNTVIAERDEILASSTIHASNVVRSLKEKISIRKRWKFTVNKQRENSSNDGNKDSSISDSLPLFTLKNPLMKGATRNLNLFEPRWLKMIDEVTKDRDPTEQTFGCVRCTNKFYSAIDIDGVESRYADVIFERRGRFATIKDLREGQRPVSGDRKVNVSIQGGESFIVDDTNLSMSDDGYIVAANVEPIDDGTSADDIRSYQEGKKVTMVVVVGLLHGNGVVDLLSKA